MIKQTINIKLQDLQLQTGNWTFPFEADAVLNVTQHWESNTSSGRFDLKFKFNIKNQMLNILNVNLNLIEPSSYIEVKYINQQIIRDKKIKEILS